MSTVIQKKKRASSKKTGQKNTRERILDVSAELFSKRGYNGTSLRDIADALNLKAGSLYHHFDSKEQLISEVLIIGTSNIYENVIKKTGKLPENASTRTILVAAAKGHLEALHEKGDYSSTSIRNYGQMEKKTLDKVLKIRNAYEDLWKGWLTQAVEKGEIRSDIDLKILRLTIMGAFNRTLEWYKKGEYSIGEIAELQIGFFWEAIGKD